MTEELRRALMALRLEVAKSIVDDIETIVERGLTEAWKGGIEEMQNVAHLCNDTRRFPGAVLSAQEYERWLDGELDIMAERLKERGND